MRYAPYIAAAVIVGLLCVFTSTRGQVGRAYADPATRPSNTPPAPMVDTTAMRALTAEAQGYPRIGADVEIGLAPSAAVPAPFNNAGRKCHGRLLAFDADWVGIQAREYDVKVWLPRESIGYVAEIPGTGNH
jgi:hypothetical protein